MKKLAIILTLFFSINGFTQSIEFFGFGNVNVADICLKTTINGELLQIKKIHEQLRTSEKATSLNCMVIESIGSDIKELEQACAKLRETGLDLNISVSVIDINFLSEDEATVLDNAKMCLD